MSKRQDLAQKVEKLQMELDGISKSLTMFHVFIEEGRSIPSEETLIDMTWGLTQYIDRIVADLGDVSSELMKIRFQEEGTEAEAKT